jgi:hypothetical protein
VVFAVNSALIVAGGVGYRLAVSRLGPRALRAAGVIAALAAAIAPAAASAHGRDGPGSWQNVPLWLS